MYAAASPRRSGCSGENLEPDCPGIGRIPFAYAAKRYFVYHAEMETSTNLTIPRCSSSISPTPTPRTSVIIFNASTRFTGFSGRNNPSEYPCTNRRDAASQTTCSYQLETEMSAKQRTLAGSGMMPCAR